MKKILLMVFVLFVVFPFVSGVGGELVYKLNEGINLTVPCANNGTYCSTGAVCNLTVVYPSNAILVQGAEMTNQNSFFNYTLNESMINVNGDYQNYLFCVDGAYNDFVSFSFEVTPSGTKPSVAQGLIYVALIVVAFVILGLSVFGFFAIDGKNQFDFGGKIILINLNKYLKFGLFFLSYILLLIVVFFMWQITISFLFLVFAANVLRIIFLFLLILLFPLFIVGVAVLFVRFLLLDYNLMLLKKRGLRKRT